MIPEIMFDDTDLLYMLQCLVIVLSLFCDNLPRKRQLVLGSFSRWRT